MGQRERQLPLLPQHFKRKSYGMNSISSKRKPRQALPAPGELLIHSVSPFEREGSPLVGFADIQIGAIRIEGVMIFRRASDGKEWIGMPSKKVKEEYVPIVTLYDSEMHKRIAREANEILNES